MHELTQKASVEVFVLFSYKNRVPTHFYSDSIFEKKLRPRLKKILGENLKFSEPFPNEIKSESIGVQCSISVDDNLKLKTPRDHDIE